MDCHGFKSGRTVSKVQVVGTLRILSQLLAKPNYDKSEFAAPAPLFNGDDAQIEKVWKSAYSLKDFLKEENFKSYDELKAKLDRVLGAGGAAGVTAKRIDDEEASAPVVRSTPTKKATAEEVTVEDDDMAFFEKLASE
jgi:hypothetical protein